jgi:ribosomal protein S18 acetylase RimI-like enzyme
MGRRTRQHDDRTAATLRAVATADARVDDVRSTELSELAWSGDSMHLASLAGELERRDRGELDYLAVRDRRGRAVAIGAIKWTHAPHAGYLCQLCTHPKQRGRGLMRALMAAGEQRIRDRGLTWAKLSVEVDNPAARAMYERLGYKPRGEGEESWEKTGPDGQAFLYVCQVTHMRKRLRPSP